MPVAAEPANPTDAYRRAARRLRCRYASHPGRLQRSLKRLAEDASPAGEYPGTSAAVERPGRGWHPTSGRSGPARRFAEHLAAQTRSASVLRYSQRLELLRAARRYGVGRFEANLMIAAIVERGRRGKSSGTVEPATEPAGAWLGGVAVFLAVQGAIAIGAWWALFA